MSSGSELTFTPGEMKLTIGSTVSPSGVVDVKPEDILWLQGFKDAQRFMWSPDHGSKFDYSQGHTFGVNLRNMTSGAAPATPMGVTPDVQVFVNEATKSLQGKINALTTLAEGLAARCEGQQKFIDDLRARIVELEDVEAAVRMAANENYGRF